MLGRIMGDGLRFGWNSEMSSGRISFPPRAMGLWHLVVLGFYPYDGTFVDKEDFFGTLLVLYIG